MKDLLKLKNEKGLLNNNNKNKNGLVNFWKIKKILKQQIKSENRARLFNQYILPAMPYGSETFVSDPYVITGKILNQLINYFFLD